MSVAVGDASIIRGMRVVYVPLCSIAITVMTIL